MVERTFTRFAQKCRDVFSTDSSVPAMQFAST
jgi:hypothetical protein